MRLVLLGTAAGGGFPQWNCACALCRRARAGDRLTRPRTQCSVAASADGRRWLLLEASPDLSAQLAATPVLHPSGAERDTPPSRGTRDTPPSRGTRDTPPSRGTRDTPIEAVLVTSGDIDHIAGLLSLRERQAFTLLATGSVLSVLDRNPVFDVLDRDLVRRQALRLDEPVEVAGLRVTPFAVPGKPPLWLEGRMADAADQVIAVELAAGGRRICYVPGCLAVTPELKRRLDGADLLLFDGTVWTDDELIAAGVGVKTGRRMGHQPLSGPDGAIAALRDLAVGRRIFLHLNNTNPLLAEESLERDRAASAGWDVGHDGMELAP